MARFNPMAEQCSLAASASLQINNLDAYSAGDGTTYYCYVSGSSVWMTKAVQGAEDEHRQFCASEGTGAIHQAKFVLHGAQALLVVVGTLVQRIFGLNGRCLLTHKISPPAHQPEDGDSVGQLHLIDLGQMRPGAVLATPHAGPITCMAADEGATQLVVGDEERRVSFWQVEGHGLRLLSHLEAEDAQPVHALQVLDKFVFVGQANGSIHVYTSSTYERVAMLNAHARTLFAMATSPAQRLLVTVGLDSKAIVYQLPPPLSGQGIAGLRAVFSATIKDRFLTGVAFNAAGDIRVACFDSYKMVQFDQQPATIA
ncbi:uncharacterized protein MONBRDRAFT_22093 [Monosiga brevicollis MX1]|uniref:Uncharacterized protein n=1 Tax=Monosiga brevicollis TaxID=81824 RepID=A9UPJ5_MONBE|nr:uncharacterized protein MONBRDRAFT_22093 [Monosiga brevicollis MX1]EDQ92434.1 predicted protein [Monosiga brevicollis MX1]|eukprot:XP_001742196.1 hypothetical protein [Monosiga brevicollis MX1]